jgi:MbtH protein
VATEPDPTGSDFAVVVNNEDQYSIWPAGDVFPTGWRTVGIRGAKKDCLSYIKEIWIDMRPLSLREQGKARLADV